MDKHDFHTIENLFQEVLQKSTDEERRRFLDDKCQNNDQLRSKMSSILRAHSHAKDYLETDAVSEHFQLLTSIFSPRPESTFDESEIIKFLEPPVQDAALGRLGHYDILGIIGHGATGVVLGGVDSRLDRPVAVKLLASQFALDNVARQRFMREARISASLKHDNIITVFDVDSSGRLPYLVMEKIDGESLFDLLKRKDSLKVSEVVKISHQIAAGLAYAHGKGVTHRDIKPSNILLESATQRVKITDFGLARAGDDSSLTRTGQCAGTPTFMSPEQARGEAVDARSDLFSLGCTMYAMCTGKSPFEGDSTFTVMRQVCEDKPQPIAELNRDIPKWLSVVVDALLEKDPQNRIKSAEKLETILRKCRNRLRKGKPIAIRNNSNGTKLDEPKTKEQPIEPVPGTEVADPVISPVGRETTDPLPEFDAADLRPSPANRTRSRRTRSRRVLVANVIGVVVFGMFGLYVGGLILNQQFGINVWGILAERDGDPPKAEDNEPPRRRQPPFNTMPNMPDPNRPIPDSDPDLKPDSDHDRGETFPDDNNGQPNVETQRETVPKPAIAIAPFTNDDAKALQAGWAVYMGTPVTLTNSIGMELRKIPPGTFTMGEGDDAHQVTLTQPFYLGVYEVTQEQYERVMGINPSRFRGSQNPVDQVSWEDALEFCLKLSALPKERAAGREYRLPTEAEWEHACRAGTATEFSFGDDKSQLDEYAWYKNNSVKNGHDQTHPVGQKQANPWGLFDMHGNVWEWCRDWYADYPAGAVTDPTGPLTGERRVTRGGGWMDDAAACRSTSRLGYLPSYRGSHRSGFRVVLTRPVPAMAVAPFDAETAREHQEAWAKYLNRPVTYTNSIGMELAFIPPGEFTMGSPPDEERQLDNETQHRVEIGGPLYMATTEATSMQWKQVMEPGAGRQEDGDGSNYPANRIKWQRAMEFCDRLSQMEGIVYRLPTEAEWEYACRAGTSSTFFHGNSEDQLGDFAWYRSNVRNQGGDSHKSVGTRKPNAFGLFDMHGNVVEWCLDWYADDYYRVTPRLNPRGPAKGTKRVFRGGNWVNGSVHCRSAYREGGDPDKYPYLRFVGFRVVLEVDSVDKHNNAKTLDAGHSVKSDSDKEVNPPVGVRGVQPKDLFSTNVKNVIAVKSPDRVVELQEHYEWIIPQLYELRDLEMHDPKRATKEARERQKSPAFKRSVIFAKEHGTKLELGTMLMVVGIHQADDGHQYAKMRMLPDRTIVYLPTSVLNSGLFRRGR